MPNRMTAPTALEERVQAHDREIANIRGELQSIETKVDKIFAAVSGLRSTNWQIIWPAASVTIAVITIIGGMAWFPVVSSVNELKGNQYYRLRTEMTTFMPRSEIEAIHTSFDKQLATLKEGQMDIVQRFGETWTVRDALNEINERIDRLQESREIDNLQKNGFQ